MMTLSEEIRERIRKPYALRRVPVESFIYLLPLPASVSSGDIALARVEKIGKNTRLELPEGRRCSLHVGDLIAVVFGNRYATLQFEGYAATDGDNCDLLSMGGLCGLVESKHESVGEPSKLRLLGALSDGMRPLRLRDFALSPTKPSRKQPRVVAICGSSMNSGKTHTAMSLTVGLIRGQKRVASIKITGTSAGTDNWTLLDAGASPVLDFVDGGFPSTYLCTLDELLHLYRLLVAEATNSDAEWVVLEIADGLLQRETSSLLQSSAFRSGIDAWVFATGDPLAAESGVRTLRSWGIEPLAVSGLLTLSPLAMREATSATGLPCLTSEELQKGELNQQLFEHLEMLATAPVPTGLDVS